jgi:2-methylcitrate dehydratase PrpD
MAKPLPVGHCTDNGLLEALAAHRGFSASTSILKGHFGFPNLLVHPRMFGFISLTKEFGNP